MVSAASVATTQRAVFKEILPSEVTSLGASNVDEIAECRNGLSNHN